MRRRLPTTVTAIVYTLPLGQIETAGFDLRPEHIARELPVRVEQRPGGVWLHCVDPRMGDDDPREIANATRYTRAGGATFTGWVVHRIDHHHTGYLPDQPTALRNLLYLTEDYLNAHLVYGRHGRRLIDNYPADNH